MGVSCILIFEGEQFSMGSELLISEKCDGQSAPTPIEGFMPIASTVLLLDVPGSGYVEMNTTISSNSSFSSFSFGVATGFPTGGAGVHSMCWGLAPAGNLTLFVVRIGALTLIGPDLADYK